MIGSAAIMKLGSEVYLGEQADFSHAVGSVIPKVFALLWAGFLKAILYAIGFLVFFVGEFYVAARFFAVYRDLTAGAFYTSPVGRKDLGYIGNVPLAHFDGAPPELLKKLNLA